MVASVMLASALAGSAISGLRCERWASLSNQVLSIDSTAVSRDFAWNRYALEDRDGSFVPGRRYTVTFRAKVEAGAKNSFLYVLVRPGGEPSERHDAGSVAVQPTWGRWQDVRLEVGEIERPDQRLQIHGFNRLRAEIADLAIVERAPLVFVPARENHLAGAAPETPAFTPTGAQEFEVDAPRPTGGPVLDAAAFGVSEAKCDNFSALKAALAAARKQKASKFVVPKGVYRLTADDSLTLEGLSDFTFDGGGSTFVSHRRTAAFMRIESCTRVRVMNFKLDWDWAREPLASLVRVAAVQQESYDLEFVDYPDFPDKDAHLVILSVFDPRTRSVGLEDGITRSIDFRRTDDPDGYRTWVAPNVVRVRQQPGGLAPGQLYRLQHYYYQMNGIAMRSNAHLRLENVTVLSTPGHAFLIGGTQHHTLFEQVDIVAPKDDPRRIITCTADHLHIAQSRGYLKLDRCEFSLGADDILNMHDNSGFARRKDAHTIRTQNARAYGSLPKGTKIELRHGDYSPTGFTGTVRKVRTVDAKGSVYDITFEEEVPEQTTDGFVMFDKTYDTQNVIVRNCHFHDNRARGLLILARNVTVENNVFRHQEMGAIKIETGYTLNLWSEGYGVSNVVIRGNLFDTVNPSGANAVHGRRAIYAGIYLRTDPSADTTSYPIIRDLLIEGNTFRDTCGVVGWLSSVRGVTVRGNVFEDPTPRRTEMACRAQFRLANARDVRVQDNEWRASPCVKAPGVVFDPESCADIRVARNRVTQGAAAGAGNESAQEGVQP
ncbi:MAG: right-handed parallel beta-helix repeat-containing protein [Kiritimatiellia bacterium]